MGKLEQYEVMKVRFQPSGSCAVRWAQAGPGAGQGAGWRRLRRRRFLAVSAGPGACGLLLCCLCPGQALPRGAGTDAAHDSCPVRSGG